MKRLGVFVVAALLVASASVYSQPAEGRGCDKFIEQLKLSDEQKKDVDRIHIDIKKQEIAQKAKLETAKVELRQLFKSENPDRSSIENKLNEIAGLESQMRIIRINTWFEVNKLLNKEQQKTWKKALERGFEMEHKKMGMEDRGHNLMPHCEEGKMPKNKQH